MEHFNILLVDDSEEILKSLRRALKPEGYKIHTATSAKDALTTLSRETIDLMITDESMPGGSGTELLKSVRELFPDVIRIMLTGLKDIEIAKNAINNGEIYRFFNKPWDDFELLISVRNALRSKSLEKENAHLKHLCQRQQELLQQIEVEHPGISKKNMSDDGAYILDV